MQVNGFPCAVVMKRGRRLPTTSTCEPVHVPVHVLHSQVFCTALLQREMEFRRNGLIHSVARVLGGYTNSGLEPNLPYIINPVNLFVFRPFGLVRFFS